MNKTKARIDYLRTELENESISLLELLEIQEAFELLDTATLREEPENASAEDMLDEVEEYLTKEGSIQ